jgi:alpha/beta superfamily hydrolase
MTDEPSAAPAMPIHTALVTADAISLVAEVTLPTAPVRGAASIAHPHPLYGGTMHDAVVMTIDHALVAAGLATVRFAFRGTGGSGGTHSGGAGERLDVLAALEHAASVAPGRPLLACGYSFGADVTLACADDRVAAWMVVAPPLRVVETFAAASDPRPKHLLVAAHDQYNPPDAARAATAAWRNTTIHVVDGADHFFHGAHATLRETFTKLVANLDLQ